MPIVNYTGNWKGYLEYSLSTVSQDITNNRSTLRVSVSIGQYSGGSLAFNNTYGNVVQITVAGTTKNLTVGALNLNGSKKSLGYQDFVVNHSADGTGKVTVSIYSKMDNIAYASWNFGNASASTSYTFTTIPRSSTLSAGSGVIGSALAITINRQSSSFTHTLRYSWGSKTGTIASNVGTSHSWTIPNDFANDIPNATSGTGTLYVDTYNGSTKTGTQQISFTASVPSSIKPSFSGVTLTDSNGVVRSLLTGNNFLQVISDIQVTFNGAAGSYGSSITGYKAEIVNKNQVTTSNGGRLGIMNFSGSATIRASVVDSRGRWSDTRDVTINVIEYFAPVLSFTAVRTRETPNIIQIVRNAKIAPLTLSGSQKNIMTLSFKVAQLGSTSFSADNGSATGTYTTQHTLTNSAANMAGNYPANKSFTVIGTLSDKFTSVEFSATVATESVVMSYDKDGRLGVGKVAENGGAGSLDVAGDIYARGRNIQQHPLTQLYGQAITANGSWDDYQETGFYQGHNLSSQPPGGFGEHGWKYVRVTKHNHLWCVQEAIDFNGKTAWMRTRSNGVWQKWTVPGLNQFYPVGSIYQSTNATNPSTFMGGTWERFGNGKVLVGVDNGDADFNTANKTGGAKTHTLTADEMPVHSHAQRVTANTGNGTAIRRDWSSDVPAGQNALTYPQGINTGNAGGGKAHNNMPPYITVYMWRRIA